MREAKLHSTWTSPDTAYEQAMQDLARDALDPSRGVPGQLSAVRAKDRHGLGCRTASSRP